MQSNYLKQKSGSEITVAAHLGQGRNGEFEPGKVQ